MGNGREQDLMLLAKNHYKVPRGYRRADVARIIVGLHNLHDPSTMDWRDAASVVAHDLINSGLVPMTPDKMTRLMIDLGPHPLRILGPDLDQPGGYYAALIDKLLEAAMMVRVREGDVYLLPWEMSADPQVIDWLESLAADEGSEPC